jgi:hypothetical protein
MRELCGVLQRQRQPRREDCFCLKFAFLYLEIVLQQVGVAGKAGDPAIGVLKYDQVKLSSPSWNLSRDLADSPEQSQLLQQPRGDPTSNITDDDGLARFSSKYMSWVHAYQRNR